MKAFYIHGLESNGLSEEKKAALYSLGLEVTAPVYAFKQNKELIYQIEQDIYEELPNFLIGSSLGGCLAFYLSNKLNLPALLFNPALGIERQSRHQNIPEALLRAPKCTFQKMILGEKDATVIPSETLAFLKLHYPKDMHSYEIVSDLEHRIPAEILASKTEAFLYTHMHATDY